MVKVREDMTGWIMSEHGVPDSKLTILRQCEDYIKPNGKREAQWLCQCNCDQKKLIIATSSSIKRGNTKSCGCIRGTNKYNIDGCYGIGWSSNTNEEFYFSLDKYDLIKKYVWRVSIDKRNGYKSLVTSIHLPDGKCKIKTMWSVITGYDYCDHKNGNTLDNRDENLRKSNHLLNMQNRKIHKNNKSSEIGISVDNNKYMVGIRYNNNEYNLGVYEDFDTALLVRVRAEAAVFDPEYAPHRHLFEQYNIDIKDEKDYWDKWILTSGINYLGYPIHPWQKKVVQLTLDGKYINVFDSMAIASKQTGVSYSGIQSCCNKKGRSAGGYLWVFEKEYNPDEVVYTYKTNYIQRSVIKLSINGDFIKKYKTIACASKENDINYTCILDCCKGKQKTAGGFKWRYADETQQNNLENQ